MRQEPVAELAHSAVDCTDTAVDQGTARHMKAGVAVHCTDLALQAAAVARRIESKSAAQDTALVHTVQDILRFGLAADHIDLGYPAAAAQSADTASYSEKTS